MAEKTRNYGLVTSPEKLSKFVDRLVSDGRAIGFDIETGYEGPDQDAASLHPEQGFIVGISFTNSTEWARYVPLRHENSINMDEREAARLFWRMLSSGLGVAHNAKFERRFLSTWFRKMLWDDAEYGEAVRASNGYFPVLSDTILEAYLDASQRSFGLKSLTKSLFGHDQAEFESLFPKVAKNKQKSLRFNVLALTPAVVAYACEDAAWCLALHEHFYPKVKDMLLYRVEMRIMEILCEMEDFGVLYDWAAMSQIQSKAEIFLNKQNEEIQAELSNLVGTPISINLGSPKQLADILYGELGMTTTRKSKSTGAMSTDAIAMAGLAKEHPVVQKILEWKEMRTLVTRYLDKYQKEFNYASDGRAHPNHMQTVVPTGRFAVSEPPYQQSPKYYKYETSDGSRFELNFRDFIIAPPEHYILGFDYSQIELRMMAGESGEPTLLRSFNEDEDVHTATAALMLGMPLSQVDSDTRAIGKMLNFALLYGMGAKSLAERLAISKEEAQRLYDQYFEAYSAISVWVDRVTVEGKANGYASTLFGRKCTIWEFQSSDGYIRSKGDRLCVNAPIQGAAADYMKIAMVRADDALAKAGLKDRVHLVMNIHDALEFYVHESLTPQEVISVLRPAVEFEVPKLPKIVADWHIGTKWGSVAELSTDLSELEETSIQPDARQDDPAPPVPSAPEESPTAKSFDLAPASPTVIVQVEQMPTALQYQRWLDLVASRPGDNMLILRTPEGDIVHEGEGSSLGIHNKADIGMIFGKVQVVLDEKTVDLDAMAEGLI